MRDPKRIKPLLKLLERVWSKHPTLRLGQLISNAVTGPDAFYIEDDELLEGLKELEKQP